MTKNTPDIKGGVWSNIPIIIALFATFVPVFLLEKAIMGQTGGTFMYPLDDPFIHMQVARNLTFFDTWGINPHEFGSASSSILYTLLLAAIFKFFSTAVIVPFIINCIAALLLLIFIDKWLKKQDMNEAARMVILLLVVFLTPLPTLIISGMEHTLHCLIFALFLTGFADYMENEVDSTGKNRMVFWRLVVYAMLVTSIRYEGLFVVAFACLILLFRRKIVPSFLLGILALLPIVVFGIVSVNQGSYFLPNSVLVKSEGMQFSLHGVIDFLSNILINKLTIVKTQNAPIGSPPPGISLLATQRLLVILPLVYLLFAVQLKLKRTYSYILLMLTAVVLLHLSFAATGWFYRYEAYLIMFSVVIISTIVYKYGRQALGETVSASKIITVVFLFVLFFPFILRSSAAYSKAKQACVNIYEQQYQMADFLREYYKGDVIAANDIGAISYYGGINVVDLWGLGSIEVARSKKGNYWTPEFLDSLVRKKDVDLILIYDKWFDQKLLNRWTKIATWQISNNVICGDDTVSFYVKDKINAGEAHKRMKEYQLNKLARRVTVKYFSETE